MRPLRYFFMRQSNFQDHVQMQEKGKCVAELTVQERNAILIQQSLSAHTELSEFVNAATNYKNHENPKPLDREKALEEGVDAFKYVLNLIIYGGWTVDEFIEMFEKKSDIVEQKFRREFGIPDRLNLHGCGIDGCYGPDSIYHNAGFGGPPFDSGAGQAGRR